MAVNTGLARLRRLRLVDECGSYIKPNQCHFRYIAILKRPSFWASCFPTLVDSSKEKWDNKLPFNSVFTQQYLCQKNTKNRLMCVEVIVCYISVVF